MKGVISLLKSRKAWVTIFGIITSISGYAFGSPEQAYLLAGLCAILVLSIMGEDIAKHLKVDLPEDKPGGKDKDEMKAIVSELVELYMKDKKNT